VKNTLIVLSSNRSVERKTESCIRELQKRGAAYMPHLDAPADVACARNIAFSIACEQMRVHQHFNVVLCVDDDMEFSAEVAQELVDAARLEQVAAAAVYGTVAQMVAAEPWPEKPGRFQAGLGLLAIPRDALLKLEQESETFELQGAAISEFVWCCAEAGLWVSEDYRLCRRLGGVNLLPVKAGHIKKSTIWPSDETIEAVKGWIEKAAASV
jgi:hypothetical protein